MAYKKYIFSQRMQSIGILIANLERINAQWLLQRHLENFQRTQFRNCRLGQSEGIRTQP